MRRSRLPVPVPLLVALGFAACAEPGPVSPSPDEPGADPAVTAAVRAAAPRGPAAVARLHLPGGGTKIEVLEGRELDEASEPQGDDRTLAAATGPADLPPSQLLFVTNPAGGRWVENRPNEVPITWLFFCGQEQLTEVRVDSTVQRARENTGGHISSAHVGDRPVGSWTPESGVVTDGTFEQTYTSEIASGDETLNLFWTTIEEGSPCEGLTTRTFAPVGVRILGLVELSEGTDLFFDDITSNHFSVFAVRPDVGLRVGLAAAAYRAVTSERLRLNAASLPFGGINDVRFDWAPPHQTHRIGTDVDLDSEVHSIDKLRIIESLGEAAGFRKCEIHGGNHIHCYGNSQPYSTF